MTGIERRGFTLGLAGAAAVSGIGSVLAQVSAKDEGKGSIVTKRIGLIGGLALRAGVFYYEQLLQRFNARRETLDLVLYHADVKQVLAAIGSGDKAALGKYLGTLANQLFDGGAGLVAVSAVAPHLAIKEISAQARGPVVNVLETIGSGLNSEKLRRVAIFGNRAVMQTNIFGAVPEEMVVKLPPDRLEAVHNTYNDIALNGKRGSSKEVAFLDEVAQEAIKAGAEAIVLAGTDLSSFYAEKKPDFRFLDVAQLHIDQIVSLTIGR